MKKPSSSLRTRLALSHIVVVAVGATTMLIAGNRLSPALVGDHFRQMEEMAGGMMGHSAVVNLEQGILEGFNRALLIAAAASVVVALIATAVSSSRLLRPLEAIRRATRRLANGDYQHRIESPAETELAALAADVNALAAALEETETRRMRLISEVAHELRTPLATMKGYMEGLIDGVFPPSTEVYAATAREAERLERLASDLAELSRSEEGQVEFDVRRVDLAALARDVVARLRPQFEDGRVELEVTFTGPLWVEADPDRMAQVLTNVVGNALTYTPEGGEVSVHGEQRRGVVRIAVVDTGRGLTPEQIDIVFERFYRADRSVPGGTGIGLTIARSIVQRHGGDITVSSEGPGRGSVFTIEVPTSR